MKDFIKAILITLATAGVCYLFWWATGLNQKFGEFSFLNWLGVVLILNVLNPNNRLNTNSTLKKDDSKGH